MKRNWQTTAAGIAAIVGAICNVITAVYDGDILTSPDYAVVATMIVVGIGLLRAKDSKNPN